MARGWTRVSAWMLALCWVLWGAPAHTAVPERAVYLYAITANGADIGRHRLAISRVGERTTVEISIRILMRVAGIAVYRMDHDSTEEWVADRLVSLRAFSVENGRRFTLEAKREGDTLVVQGERGTLTLPGTSEPVSYWRPSMLKTGVYFDTQWGSVLDLSVQEEGADQVDGAPTRRFRLSGTEILNGRRATSPWLSLSVWTRADGVFAAKQFRYGGRDIRYTLLPTGAAEPPPLPPITNRGVVAANREEPAQSR